MEKPERPEWTGISPSIDGDGQLGTPARQKPGQKEKGTPGLLRRRSTRHRRSILVGTAGTCGDFSQIVLIIRVAVPGNSVEDFCQSLLPEMLARRMISSTEITR